MSWSCLRTIVHVEVQYMFLYIFMLMYIVHTHVHCLCACERICLGMCSCTLTFWREFATKGNEPRDKKMASCRWHAGANIGAGTQLWQRVHSAWHTWIDRRYIVKEDDIHKDIMSPTNMTHRLRCDWFVCKHYTHTYGVTSAYTAYRRQVTCEGSGCVQYSLHILGPSFSADRIYRQKVKEAERVRETAWRKVGIRL